MSKTVISAKQIKKAYKDLQVLKGVDLTISESEIISIVGASGAGKTTLLQILGTLDKPDYASDTELTINNQSIKSLNDKALAKFRNKNIGFIFQFHQLLPEFTALENACIPAFINKTPKAEAETNFGDEDDFGDDFEAEATPTESESTEEDDDFGDDDFGDF